MPTSIPTVKVTPLEAGAGFLITCNQHPTFRLIRAHRDHADEIARDHQNDHARRSH